MQLDFTAIRGNLAEKPLESPVAAFVERDSKEVPVEPKTPQKAPQRATEGTETADSKQRIERAIQAHKDRISQLQGLIEE
jgi:hypothetical protein